MTAQVVLASGNPDKIREIQAILQDFRIVAQSEFNVPEAEETGTTFVENAIIKARNAARFSKLPAIADDSGIETDALNGAPGIYSARYAGPEADDDANLNRLLDEMAAITDPHRTARFRCVIVYMRHAMDPCPLIAQGCWEGQLIREPRGSNGFGYDPIFYLSEKRCTSAELPAEEKNRISHRGQALHQLRRLLAESAIQEIQGQTR